MSGSFPLFCSGYLLGFFSGSDLFTYTAVNSFRAELKNKIVEMGMREERKCKVYLVECERSGAHLEIPYLFLLTKRSRPREVISAFLDETFVFDKELDLGCRDLTG